MLNLTEKKKVAILLHNTTCNWNHTDGCSWFYEIDHGKHDWKSIEHRQWLEKAERVSKLFPAMSAKQIIETVTLAQEIRRA